MKSYIKEFGLRLFLILGFTRIMRMIKLPHRMVERYTKFKHKLVENYLWERYGYLCEETNCVLSHDEISRVYVFWWQGESEAPEVVRMCINSIRKNCDMEVICLSKDNFLNYVDIPDYIIAKAQNGIMSLAHFSDILRFLLLYEKGGVWIDATCLLTAYIPEDIFQYQFYSLNGPFRNVIGLEWQWTSFYMSGQPGNVLSKRMVDFFYQYWKEHQHAITYLFLDCWISTMYRHCNDVKTIIDKMPCTDMNVFALDNIMNMPYDKEELQSVLKKSYIHKITYKKQYITEVDGLTTNWKYLLEGEQYACKQTEKMA